MVRILLLPGPPLGPQIARGCAESHCLCDTLEGEGVFTAPRFTPWVRQFMFKFYLRLLFTSWQLSEAFGGMRASCGLS